MRPCRRAEDLASASIPTRAARRPTRTSTARCIPEEPQLTSKGIAIALADGIGSSDVSQIASEAAVDSFLDDYYCTSDAWSVKSRRSAC